MVEGVPSLRRTDGGRGRDLTDTNDAVVEDAAPKVGVFRALCRACGAHEGHIDIWTEEVDAPAEVPAAEPDAPADEPDDGTDEGASQ